ncbi:MAG: glycosyltransferase family 2 protein [Magnetococcales bacterium]|nr:glycosyltransferase family 2 protein [Magnetococcales bacterium]MBF0149219.1 glycosyltransferase family 2 protein [Magnetococcales bacterium]MBF0171985.1 glycosyltransferase family 2 protein [Magnetococcales bacterium]MBF0346633.1 glycosyltransferase family 2 protein [Magnetococcales bacterium]MBF0630567.1 glycosyltransferase family 2 protein [Magnetococcales bacterium]
MRRALLSIVTPFYNEGEGVHAFFNELYEELEKIPDIDWEVVAIDDGSRDNTFNLLLDHSHRDGRIKVLELSRNFGKELALKAGLDHISGDVAIVMDADLQDPVYLIPGMLQQWRNGFDVVLGIREDRSSDTRLKRWTSSAFYTLFNMISDTQIPVNAGDFRLMDRKVVEILGTMNECNRFNKGIFAWVGFRTTSLPYVRPIRLIGQTKWNFIQLLLLAWQGVTSFSAFPLKLLTVGGLFLCIVTFIYGSFLIFDTLILGGDVPGYPSIMVTILFFSGVQMLSLGIVGEYIGRIYSETKKRPPYVIRKIHQQKHESHQHQDHRSIHTFGDHPFHPTHFRHHQT